MQGKDSPRLLAYLWIVAIAALFPVVVVGQEALDLGVSGLGARGLTTIALLSAILIAGELWPIPVARGEEAGDEITVSSTFGFALLLRADADLSEEAEEVRDLCEEELALGSLCICRKGQEKSKQQDEEIDMCVHPVRVVR